MTRRPILGALVAVALATVALVPGSAQEDRAVTIQSMDVRENIYVISGAGADGLTYPWRYAFLPDGRPLRGIRSPNSPSSVSSPVLDTTPELLEMFEVVFLLAPLPDLPEIDLLTASDVNRHLETLAVVPMVERRQAISARVGRR